MGAFAPGDVVRVASAHPPGHRRTPFYVRGKRGIIERVCGDFANPEELAYGFSGRPKRTLYRVRFRQNDVWPHYSGAENDALLVDLYEHWLAKVEPASAQEN